MTDNSKRSRNWFNQGGADYARFRPEYPPALATYLAHASPSVQLAVDVGCGNGQLAQLLTPHFNNVIGIDPSADQIGNANSTEKVTYKCAPAEHLPLPDGCANLITAAQAAHWFDLHAFYSEVRRVSTPDAVIALISYGVLTLEPELNNIFQNFYLNGVGPYWPPERALVDSGYSTIAFPFEELKAPPLEIRQKWRLREFLGYLFTSSAVRKIREAGHEEGLLAFTHEFSEAWGNEDTQRSITWPINMRIGRVALPTTL